MSVKKPLSHPKVWRGKVARVLHQNEGGATDGSKDLILKKKSIEEETSIKLETWDSRTTSGCLEARVGVK